MLKYSGEVVRGWMTKLCRLALVSGGVLVKWWKPFWLHYNYKGKDGGYKCTVERFIGMLSISWKVQGRVIVERVKKQTEGRVSEEQYRSLSGGWYVDQIIYTTQCETRCGEVLEKNRKLYVAFMDSEKVLERMDWEDLWRTLRMYGLGADGWKLQISKIIVGHVWKWARAEWRLFVCCWTCTSVKVK